jgi:hypothetical protein
VDATITLVFDGDKGIVTMGMERVPIGLAQMMVHEATVQLDIMRRRLAMQEMQVQAMEAARVNGILAGNRHKG